MSEDTAPTELDQTKYPDAIAVATEEAGTPAAGGLDPTQYPDAEGTLEQKVGTFAQRAPAEFAKGAAITAGAAMGAKIGAAAGAATGPAAPVALPILAGVGLVSGAGAGYLFGEGIKDILHIPETKELPTHLQPYAVAGETFGTGLSMIAGPLAAARTGSNLLGKYFDSLVQRAREAPAIFASLETQGLAAASYLGGVAHAYLPENWWARMGAEVLGGVASPVKWGTWAGHKAYEGAERALGAMSEQGRQTRAGQILKEIVEATRGDPDALTAVLREAGLPGTNLTSAQKTGNPGLAALEAALIKEDGRFGEEAAQRAVDGLDTIKSMILILAQTGDPAALREAAALRGGYFNRLIASRAHRAEREAMAAIQENETKAVTAAGAITDDLPVMRGELSKTVDDAMDAALKDARTVERALWKVVPNDIPANAGEFLAQHAKLRATMLPEHKMPELVGKLQERLALASEGGNAAYTTSGELKQIRTEFLELAREAAKGTWEGHRNAARVYGELAEAVLHDIQALQTSADILPSFNAAREFSRQLNDVFTRTFAGDAAAVTRTGADKIPPEVLLRQALGSGAEPGALRFRQLEEAVGFIPKIAKEFGFHGVEKAIGAEGIEKATANFDAVMDAQERFLRLAAAAVVDPVTGRVSTYRLGAVMRDNAELMQKFPEAAKTLRAAFDVEVATKRLTPEIKASAAALTDIYSGANKAIRDQTAFATLAKMDSPVDAFGKILAGPNPLVDIHGLVKLAQYAKTRPHAAPKGDAVEGLKTTMWEYLMQKAVRGDGSFDFAALRASMDAPVRPRFPSLADIMVSNGLMKEADMAQARKLFDAAANIALATGTKKEADLGQFVPPQLIEVAVRIAGAQVGRQLATLTGGGTVQTPHYTAEFAKGFFRKLFEKLPRENTRMLLVKAAREPEFAALLLEMPKTKGDAFRLGKQLHAYLYASGLLAAQDISDDMAGP